ncbi:PBSX family phage terminase large subunit [Caulobacter sp. SSI4214]|uniref:PBSX family phage terminase large subunit n=1 Tax=Caulobacter sp. SSI4214 TaxID=2575739 RepID=UPI00143BB56B|nr:PBSX family phage terminase large subunit [Caulobacter sp. SSI4214]
MAEIAGRDPLRATLNPALRSFWRIPARNRVLLGGRSSSKSWDAAGFAIFLASNYKVRFLCTRQFQNKIEESVYTLLKVQIERFGLRAEFDITNNKITHKTTGSEFIFYGLWRHIDEIKSLEGIDICWIEEAHNLTEAQWEILEPTVRKEGSQFWIIFNPRLASDFVYKKFVTGTPNTVIDGAVKGVVGDTIKRLINYVENPFLSNTIRKVIAKKEAEDPEEFRHIYLGEPRDDDDRAVIKRSWVLAAIGAKKHLMDEGRLSLIQARGKRQIGFDVGDTGDPCAVVERHGIEAVDLVEWKAREDELLKSVARVHAMARMADAEVMYDSIGVGAFAGGHFNDLNGLTEADVQHHKFNAGGGVLDPDKMVDPSNPGSPINGDYYSNLKAQVWWEVAGMFRATFNAVRNGMAFDPSQIISLSPELPHLDALIDELCTPLRDFDAKGKVKVESKKDLAKRDVSSPNKADAFIMAFARREVGAQAAMLLSKRHR